MKIPQRIKTEEKPEVFLDLNNGYWYYRFDIQESTETKEIQLPDSEEISQAESPMYSYINIYMYGKPTEDKCFNLVLEKFISQNEQLKFINDYNNYILGLTSEYDYIEYMKYLTLVKEIREKINMDFNGK